MRYPLRWLCSFLTVIVVLFVAARAQALTPDIPAPQGAVTDLTGKLDTADDAALESRIASYRARTDVEIGVLVLPSLGDATIEDVAFTTFNQWGVGRKGKDNGVLLVIATAERRTRIETGKGLGDRLTDLACGRILDRDLKPHLRQNQFRAGIEATLASIEAELDRTAASPTPATPSPPVPTTFRNEDDEAFHAILAVILTATLGLFIITRNPRWRRRRRNDGYRDDYSASYPDYSSSSSYSSYSSGGGDYGGGGGGGSSGGDFGGGSSGGGGASGSY
jgi:uncharacterized protein